MKLIEISPEKVNEIYVHVGKFAMSPDVVKEFEGYPVLTKEGWSWILALDKEQDCVGFLAHSHNEEEACLETMFVRKDKRLGGVFNLLYDKFISKVPSGKIKLIANKNSQPIFIKKGFVVTQAFKKWWKMELDIKSKK